VIGLEHATSVNLRQLLAVDLMMIPYGERCGYIQSSGKLSST
jgi:hypothetical protein